MSDYLKEVEFLMGELEKTGGLPIINDIKHPQIPSIREHIILKLKELLPTYTAYEVLSRPVHDPKNKSNANSKPSYEFHYLMKSSLGARKHFVAVAISPYVFKAIPCDINIAPELREYLDDVDQGNDISASYHAVDSR